MKTAVKKRWIILFSLIMFLLVLFPVTQSFVYADTQITETDMNDGNLFSKLRTLGGGLLRSETFNKEKYKTINLTGVTTANTESNIVDLSGLLLFKFDYTTKLNLSNNNIKSVSAEILSIFPNLEELILTNNKITSIDLSGCYNLKRLVIDNNELENIDLTDFNPKDGYVDVSCNYIDSMADIKFPSRTVNVSTTIDAYNNNITDYEAKTGYTINLGLQGLNTQDNRVEKNKKLVYYKTNDSQKLKTIIAKNDQTIYTFNSAEMTEPKLEFYLNNGSYNISYYYNNSGTEEIISQIDFTARPSEEYYKDYFRYYKYKEFDIVPSTPSYVYVIDGVEYKEIDKLTKEATIKVFADEDSKVYYSLNGLPWREGREIPITIGGKYNISIKAVSLDGDFESTSVIVQINASASLKFPSILIVMLIIIGAVVLFGVGFPLLRKYVL